ncbi:MAG: hypothetical protein WC707_06385 [Candidatus Babeliaceae bacterium]|jgi:hypothetical protein
MIRHNKQRLLIIALTIATAWTVDSRANVIQDHPYLTAISVAGLTILSYRAMQNIQAGWDITDLINDPEIIHKIRNDWFDMDKFTGHKIVKKYGLNQAPNSIVDQINTKMQRQKKTPETMAEPFQLARDTTTVERKMLAWARNYFAKPSSKK